MHTIVGQMVCTPFFIQPVSRFIKQHVDAIIEKCRSTQFYAESEEADKKAALLLLSRSTLDAVRKSKNTSNHESSGNRRS